MKPLTRQQSSLLTFIQGCELAPSFDEMRDALGLKSKSGVHRLIAALEERGFIRRLPNRARCIELVSEPHIPALAEVPLDHLVAEVSRRGFVFGRIERDRYRTATGEMVDQRRFVEAR